MKLQTNDRVFLRDGTTRVVLVTMGVVWLTWSTGALDVAVLDHYNRSLVNHYQAELDIRQVYRDGALYHTGS